MAPFVRSKLIRIAAVAPLFVLLVGCVPPTVTPGVPSSTTPADQSQPTSELQDNTLPEVTGLLTLTVPPPSISGPRPTLSTDADTTPAGSAPGKPQPRSPKSGVPFDGVVSGASYTAELQAPTILVAGSSKEAAQITKLLDDPTAIASVNAIDTSQYLVVAVFSGQRGSSGFTIQVTAIEDQPQAVNVSVAETGPEAGQLTNAVITYPYDIIQVLKSQLSLEQGTTWYLVDPNTKQPLAQATYP